MARFRVDTHLFRELGELLVGRDSTALVELIKNSYDADATEVTLSGDRLTSGDGSITIVDNGTGMTREDFELGFLTIAARTKETPTRRSALYERKYTGAKGIGRLAAHKLASRIDIMSVARTSARGGRSELDVTIDWNKLEEYELLEEAESAVTLGVTQLPRTKESGTTILLSPLRRRWTERQLVTFLAEVQSFEPPIMLAEPIKKALLAGKPLFAAPEVRDVNQEDPGFRVHLEGDFNIGDPLWEAVEQAASWLLDIDASASGIRYRVVPTSRTRAELPNARLVDVRAHHPHPDVGPFFQARVFIREGEQPGGRALKTWAAAASGIRVYMEGFRVLPYGDRSDDWLDIAADSTQRTPRLARLAPGARVALDEDTLPEEQEKEGLSILGPSHYFGAVYLTEERASSLRMLVNREGFVPDEAFDSLRDIVRVGVDVSVRARAAASHERRQRRRDERRQKPSGSPAPEMESVVAEVTDLARKTREQLAQNEVDQAKATADQVAGAMRRLRAEVATIQDEQALLRVVASVGTQMGAFVHELNGLVGNAKAAEEAVRALRSDSSLPRDIRGRLGDAATALNDLRQGLERQASYLTDVVSADARRRRSRQRLSERFDASVRLIQRSADRRGITIANGIPDDLRSRPMFPAEVTAIFSNLLTNAVKACEDGGRVRASGGTTEDGVRVRLENTGVEVDLDEAERWFQPFESTTVNVDAVLGQGMGLGLAITRAMVEQYGGSIRFVRPSGHYATAIELSIPEK